MMKIVRRARRLAGAVWLGGLALALPGCLLVPPPPGGSTQPVEVEQPEALTQIYRLGPQDQLRLIVFGEEDLSGNFEVDATGSLALPLIGVVEVEQLSLREAEERIKVAFDEYLVNPRISLEVVQNRPFYIFGEVQRGGEFPFVTNMHILNAVSMAGGYTPRANNRTVYITRAGTNREVPVPATSETKIFPGDIVRVGERRF